MLSFRKISSEKKYQQREESPGCFICNRDLQIKEYNHWILLANKYPYDAIASKHDLLCPKRHINSFCELSLDEISELQKIRDETEYDFEMFNRPHRQTHKPHLHIHLLIFKKTA